MRKIFTPKSIQVGQSVKLLLLILGIGLATAGQAQLAIWNTYGQTAYGTQGYAPTSLNASLTAVGLTRSDSVRTSGTAGGNLWGGTYWSFGTAQNGVDSVRYITFGLTANTGSTMSISGLDSLRIRVSATGPINFLLQYKIGSGGYQAIGAGLPWTITRPSGTTNFALAPMDLSGVTALQNVAGGVTVTFRLIPYGATSTSGAFYIGTQTSVNHLVVLGTVSTVTPITLTSFNASLVNGNTDLNWTVAEEINASGYSVERSSDATTFGEIGFVNAANAGTYSYVDASPVSGANYYRLKLVDKDGTYKYSNVVVINTGKASTSVLGVYPNPVVSTFTLTHPSAGKNATIKIISIDGKNILSQIAGIGATQSSVDVTRLVKGIYIVVFENNGTRSVTQFIK